MARPTKDQTAPQTDLEKSAQALKAAVSAHIKNPTYPKYKAVCDAALAHQETFLAPFKAPEAAPLEKAA